MRGCSHCGQDNPGGFRFCGACGAPLVEVPAPRRRARSARLVTVLFCDLVGFTARSDQADPEDVGALLRPYHARLRAEIERLGGTLDKFIGDGVMAVFGAPVAHEDDPERAVRCALRMLAAIDELNRPIPPSSWRCGSASPPARRWSPCRAARQTEGVVGDVVNTAARLQGVAPVGRGGGRGGDLPGDPEAVRLRGAGPGPGQGQGRAGADVAGGGGAQPHRRRRPSAGRLRCVGRDDELALLQRLLSSRRSPSTPCSWSPSLGEPGVGKSRLVGELAGLRRRPAGAGHLAPGPLPALRRRDHLLGARRDRQGAGRHPGVRRPLGGWRPSWRRPWPAWLDDASEREWLEARLAPLVGLAGPERPSAERDESVRRLAAVRRGHRRQPPAGAGDRGPALGRPGAARVPRAPGRPARRPTCSWWPRPGRSCSSGIPAGAAGSRTRPRISLAPLTDERDRAAGRRPARPVGAARRRSRRCCWSGPAATPCTPRSSSRLLTDRGLLVRHGNR